MNYWVAKILIYQQKLSILLIDTSIKFPFDRFKFCFYLFTGICQFFLQFINSHVINHTNNCKNNN